MKKILSILVGIVYVISAVCTVAGFCLFFETDKQLKACESSVKICKNLQTSIDANDYEAFLKEYEQAEKANIKLDYTNENNFTQNDMKAITKEQEEKTDTAKIKRFACVLLSFSGIFLICSISIALIFNALLIAKDKMKKEKSL